MIAFLKNYRYWRAHGMAPAHAWAKADLTLPPTKTRTPWH